VFPQYTSYLQTFIFMTQRKIEWMFNTHRIIFNLEHIASSVLLPKHLINNNVSSNISNVELKKLFKLKN
jgi:hypothetical protein